MIIKIKKKINAITETKEPAYIDNSDCFFIGVDINVYDQAKKLVHYMLATDLVLFYMFNLICFCLSFLVGVLYALTLQQ